MNEKERYFAAVARDTIQQITSGREAWTAFLTTLGRNYDFSYPEQIMIHAQRPDATMCKPYEEWNTDAYRRYVRRGSKGIALFVTDGEKPYLRYVFDVSDTGTRRTSPALHSWSVTEEYRRPLQEALAQAFGVDSEKMLETQLEQIAENLAVDYWNTYQNRLLDIVENSFLEGYDSYNIEVAFRRAVTTSVTYAMYTRCMDNPDEYFEHEDFLNVFDFNTRQAVNALGTAVNSISTQMFQTMELAIETYEKMKEAERSQNDDERDDVYTERGLSDPGYSADTERNKATGQVWQNEESLSEGEQSDAVQRPDPDGEVISTPGRDRSDSQMQSRTVDESVSEGESGTEQEDTSDAVGTAYEPAESTGGGSRDDGTYQQLTFDLFLPETEQIRLIDEAESRQPSAFFFSQEEIDHVLMFGSNADSSRMRVVSEFSKDKPVDALADFLKSTYRGGFGMKEDGHRISVWYSEEGIQLADGQSARYDSRAQVIPWEDAAVRIQTLLDEGSFATNVEIEEAAGYERSQLAQSLWYLAHDMSEEAREKGFLASLHEDVPVGFPDATQWLADKMADRDFLVNLRQEYTLFHAAYHQDNSLLRFHYHRTEAIRMALNELDIPRKEYHTDRTDMPLVGYFITDDEINQALTGGSGFSGGKERIYRYFAEDHSGKEKADFLKEQYGTGGRSHALSGATGSGEDHDAKGIKYHKAGCEDVKLSWIQVANRIDHLVRNGQYMEIEEKDAQTAEKVSEDEALLDQAKELIETFCQDEYDSSADFTDLMNVPIAYTTVTDDEIPIQAYVDLVDYRIDRYLDETLIESRPYDSLEDLIQNELETLEFDDLISISDDIELVQNEQETDREEVDIDASREQEIHAENFRIMDDSLGEGSPKEKFARNIQAIRTLHQLEHENRDATPEEQENLSNYVGWGGLSDAFDPNKDNWHSEYQILKDALSEDEYAAARASTLNAHFTSPTVIRAIYEAVGNMGFETGNILEPSMGVGNFFGLLPEAMRDSHLYGVELDSITGRIAQKLYPDAEIKVAGFETTDRRDFYDLAVGNVPFGNYKVSDKPYDRLGFSIHNYFFAKALDQVRPGGVIAFVTSRYTMDSKNGEARKYMAQRAELLGAIRLPNNAFKRNAGTDVVSDIIFLQKRERPMDIEPNWVHLNTTEDGFTMNEYFVDHPEMIMGELSTESTQYGKEDLTVRPIAGSELADQLKEAVSHLEGVYEAVTVSEKDILTVENPVLPADQNVKNFSYTVVDGEIYFRENSIMRHMELNEKTKERVRGMVELRQIVNELIEYQLEDYPDSMIQEKQGELNIAYDAFTEKNGLINSRGNALAFSDDSSYYLLCSLENVDEDGLLESKADMFTKRTIKPERRVTSVDTPSEALAISIGERGKVDLNYMSELLGTQGEYDRILSELQGVIFKDPMANDSIEAGWQTADEYLSGDVRSKLRIAQMAVNRDSSFEVNVQVLKQAQPKDLDASEIDVRLGATWIEPDFIQEFMEETFELPYYLRRTIEVKFSEFTAEWRINGKSAPSTNDVAAYMTYGTSRANAYRILEETLNLKDIRIYDTIEDAEGKQKRVLNKKETTLAQQKQQAIKDAFQSWVWKDPQRREILVTKYNELFNSTRPREYDGSHIRFGGMNPSITLREHQRNAIAHVLYGGNTLLAHEVGAGKTFEMAASAMESKRLGLCQKSLFVVPNHLTMQWANEFLYLYPSVKLLVATKKDFETANRKKFCARIATGDYDAVIIGHSQFEKIPLSAERQERQLREQIEEIEDAIADLKFQRGENFTIKQMEKTRKSLQTRLDKLLATDRKDDVVTFEQLGVDRLFVDESHAFKNLFLYTKMRNVAGLSTSEAQKSSDMFMKCRYMDEMTGGRGVVFATGTPVSNSMTELYTVMRYLQYGTLQKKKLTHFDCWASTFGETSTAIELAPEGTGYRARTRFAKFFNLPELMNMFKEVADIKTSDQLHLPVPDAKFETVVVQPSDYQKDMVAELSERAAAVHSGVVDPTVDNMLKITSDGRKLGLDQRLINPLLPDDPNSKLNACVGNVIRIWEEGKQEKLTQLLFCDLSTPKNDGSFNVYDDIKNKLLAHGIPQEQIAFIHDADSEAKKKDLFAKVRTGQVRVLLGSTQKMGAGTNVQDRLVAVHHLDVGWRPSDMTQRNGRIIRQGNQNKEVQVYQYVTEGTFDAYLYQTLENKQKFISQIMTSKSPVRSCDDVDEQALSYAEIKALCAGNPLIKEKMDLDIDVARLKVLKADHQSQQYRLEDQLLKYFPAEIEKQTGYIHGFEHDIQTVTAHPQVPEGFCGIEIKGRQYADKQEAGEAILAVCKESKGKDAEVIGSYRGFQMELSFDTFHQEFAITLKDSVSHKASLGTDARGNLTRLDNALAAIPEKLEKATEQLENLHNQQEAAKAELGKPFPQEAELSKKSIRLAELDAALNMEDTVEKHEERPSVLADLKSKSEQIPPVKRGENQEEVL